ncbi:MAG: alpha/beta hydrolase [Lentisphaerales bacterium]|nr:alpha/beta hydrolase [Lentisphaerales bacterium]
MYFKALLLITLSACLSSCLHNRNSNVTPNSIAVLPDYYAADFTYPKNSSEVKKVSLSENSKFKTTKYTFQSSQDLLHPSQTPHDIVFELYQPNELKHQSTLLCLPISGGNYLVSQYFAKYFARKGYNSVVIHRRKAYKNMITIDTLNTIIRQMIIDHKQVMDKLQQLKISQEEFAVIGVSKGGLKAALLSSLDHRVKASVVAIAGGDLPHILAYSQEKGVKKRRLNYLSKTAMSPLEFHDAIKEKLKYDPLILAPYFNSQNMLIVNAYFDNCVPYYNGRLLVEAHPGCQEIVLFAGHYSALPTIPYLSLKFKDFLTEKLP